MNDELKPCLCGCGGITETYKSPVTGRFLIQCSSCGIETGFFDTESEAIKAWNKAVTKRIVKVEQQIECFETRLEPNYEGMCGNCGETVYDHARYCSYCGAKLEWNHERPYQQKRSNRKR